MWRNGQGDLARCLEVTSSRRRQFVVRRRILVIQISVKHHLIAEPLVIEGHKPTVVFHLWEGARELIEVEEGRTGRAIGIGRRGAQSIGAKRCVTKEDARQTLFIADRSKPRRRNSTSRDNLIEGQR